MAHIANLPYLALEMFTREACSSESCHKYCAWYTTKPFDSTSYQV